jgi:hypothetical protein
MDHFWTPANQDVRVRRIRRASEAKLPSADERSFKPVAGAETGSADYAD